jgi:hypothetical protein
MHVQPIFRKNYLSEISSPVYGSTIKPYQTSTGIFKDIQVLGMLTALTASDRLEKLSGVASPTINVRHVAKQNKLYL